MTANKQIGLRWLERMPSRWALGGLLLAIIWSAISSYLQGSFRNPAGGIEDGLIRLLVIVVLPLTLLGLVWGYSERAKLLRAATKGPAAFREAIRRTVGRQVGKAMFCGLAFGILVNLSPYMRNHSAWDTSDHIVKNLSNASAFVLLAIPVGLVVGYALRRNLARRFPELE